MRIVKAIVDRDVNINKQPDKVKFLIQGRNKNQESIMTYREVVEHLQRNMDEEDSPENQLMKFKATSKVETQVIMVVNIMSWWIGKMVREHMNRWI